MRYIISLALLFTLLLPFSPVYGDSSIEYDDNGLTPTEQQEGNSGGFGLESARLGLERCG